MKEEKIKREQDDAALKIQKRYKGNKARKRVKEKK
jgi:hypothetical protein